MQVGQDKVVPSGFAQDVVSSEVSSHVYIYRARHHV